MLNRKDKFSGLFFFFFSLYICFESLHLGLGNWRKPGAGFFSFFSGASLGILAMSVFFQGFKLKANGKESGARSPWKGKILCLFSLLVFILLLETLGFILTSFLFIGFLIRFVEKKGWISAILTALAIALASYGLFEICLQSQLPKGILEIFGI